MTGKISISSGRCKGCAFCVQACPAGVISISGKFNEQGFFPAFSARPDLCTGCAQCAHMCPEVAIKVYREGS